MKIIYFKLIFLYLLIVSVAFLFLYMFFLVYFEDLIFPGVKIAGIEMGGQSPQKAEEIISTQFQNQATTPLVFTFSGQKITFKVTEASPVLNLNQTTSSAYRIGRSGDLLIDLKDQVLALTRGVNIAPLVKFQAPAILNARINQISSQIEKKPINAQITLGEVIAITPSKPGESLDTDQFLSQLNSFFSLAGPKPLFLPLKITQPDFSTEEAQKYKQALQTAKDGPIRLRYKDQAWTIDHTTLFTILDFKDAPGTKQDEVFPSEVITGSAIIDKNKLTDYFEELSNKVNQPTQDARFTFDPGTKRVREFQPAQEGRQLDIGKTALLLTEALTQNGSKEVELPVKTTQPKITTDSVNDFGIRELLGQGISNFSDSIENRIFNVGLASSRLNGALIPPGKIFSFNNTVGEVEASTGYKQAYVIKSGRTVLDDGGGVCQVSTTLFRAVLNSGLPVEQRTAHAYRVGYYEQGFPPGLDATVFAPSVDFKFKNDTLSYVLIQARVLGTSLYIDIYGTDDGRITTVSTPKILNQTPPLPELRQDDPTLPKGTVKQVDWPAWGANVVFNRTVKRAGETIIQETFRSNYRSWQAIYLVGTKE